MNSSSKLKIAVDCSSWTGLSFEKVFKVHRHGLMFRDCHNLTTWKHRPFLSISDGQMLDTNIIRLPFQKKSCQKLNSESLTPLATDEYVNLANQQFLVSLCKPADYNILP